MERHSHRSVFGGRRPPKDVGSRFHADVRTSAPSRQRPPMSLPELGEKEAPGNLDAFIRITDGQDAVRRCGAAAPGTQRQPLAPRRNHHFSCGDCGISSMASIANTSKDT
jgi:hypothetical protein